MKKVLRQALVTVLLFSILVLPAAWQSEAAATTVIANDLYYMFQNLHSGKFLEVADNNIVVGTNVRQGTYTYADCMPQIFRVETPETTVSDDAYHRIVPLLDFDLCLDVDNASNTDGANIKIYYNNPGLGAQSFKFISNGDGTFRIQPHLSSNRVLGVANNSTADQANVELVTWTGHNSQKWVLKKVSTLGVSHYAMNWSYFFRGVDASNYIRISQRFSKATLDDHHGIDIPADSDTEIYSPFEGKVVGVGTDDEYGMGNYIFIRTNAVDDSGKQITVRLLHLRDRPTIAKNTTIDKNTFLGYVGNTGDSKGNHLHVDANNNGYISGPQIRANSYYAINPEDFYPQIQFVYGILSSNTTYA